MINSRIFFSFSRIERFKWGGYLNSVELNQTAVHSISARFKSQRSFHSPAEV